MRDENEWVPHKWQHNTSLHERVIDCLKRTSCEMEAPEALQISIRLHFMVCLMSNTKILSSPSAARLFVEQDEGTEASPRQNYQNATQSRAGGYLNQRDLPLPNLSLPSPVQKRVSVETVPATRSCPSIGHSRGANRRDWHPCGCARAVEKSM